LHKLGISCTVSIVIAVAPSIKQGKVPPEVIVAGQVLKAGDAGNINTVVK